MRKGTLILTKQINQISNKMKRSKRNVIWFLVCFVVVAIILESFILMSLTRMNDEQAGDMQFDQVETILDDNAKHEKELIADLKKEYLAKANSVSYLLDLNPVFERDVNMLIKLAKMMDIDEIHIFDKKGYMYYGTVPKYYGLTLDSGEQVAFFKPMLNDKSLSLCQDVTPNSAEHKNMMYAMVWNRDGDKMIQVGIEPLRLLAELKNNKISTVVENMTTDEGVDVYVLTPDMKKIISATDSKMSGKSITALGFTPSKHTEKGFATINGKPRYYTCKPVDRYEVIVTSVNISGWMSSVTAIIIEFIYLLLACLIIYYYAENMLGLNTQLVKARDNAEAANAAKTSFLFNMSHDIRTPMNAIMGFRDLLEKYIDDKERRTDYLKKIEESCKVLLSIINNVLEMARIEKGTQEIVEQAWDIEQFSDTIYSIFNDMMTQKGLTFTREIKVTNSYVMCDPTKLREIVINLISNAYKYTNTGGSVNMLVEELPCDRKGWVLYRTTVSDTGIGMSEDFLPHVFDEFSRERNTTEAKIEGTGLGMPIVKRLVEILNGTIEVKSKKGVGSTFVVTIPHRIAQRSTFIQHTNVDINPDVLEGKRILLAEDNDLNAEITMEILGEVGLNIERAVDGVECCNMMSKAPAGYYNVILMDIQMPNMNGYEATRTIRAMHDEAKSRIPILALTANAFEEDKRNAERAGMNGHLSKPIDIKAILKTLTVVLG